MTTKEHYLTKENLKIKVVTWKKKLTPYKQRWQKLDIDRSALLIIDMQNYFLQEDSHAFVSAGREITGNVQKLLLLYRVKDLPVVFTYFGVKKNEKSPIEKWWGDIVSDGSPLSSIITELRPRGNEQVLRKRSYSSFHGTELEDFLNENQVKQLVITGVLTNLCCETAAREAFERNIDVFIVMDATAAYSEKMHLDSLCNLSYGFATPLSVDDL